jgi:hypothetical protein
LGKWFFSCGRKYFFGGDREVVLKKLFKGCDRGDLIFFVWISWDWGPAETWRVN